MSYYKASTQEDWVKGRVRILDPKLVAAVQYIVYHSKPCLLLKKSFKILGREYHKTIAALKNPKTQLIKKRQLMRTTLGDYRKKMANEDKAIKFGNKLIHFIINI